MFPTKASGLLPLLLLCIGLAAPQVAIAQEDPIVPRIVAYPANQSVIAGTSLRLSVSLPPFVYASGYQWRKDGIAIEGATRSSLTVSAIQPTDAGSYDCVVTTSDGEELHHPAAHVDVLTGVLPYTISPSYSIELREGGRLSLVGGARGEPPFTYQWLKNGTEIPGATSSSYSKSSVTRSDQGLYQVRATNAHGSALLNLCNITVVPAIPLNVLGHPATLVVHSEMPHPIYPEQSIGDLNGPLRLRDRSLVFQAGPSLMMWSNDQLSVLATRYDADPAGLAVEDLHAWSEPDNGDVYFIANPSASVMAVHRWRAGAVDTIARTGDLAPNGETYASFSHVAARDGTLLFVGETSGPNGNSTHVFRQINGGPVHTLLAAGTELPGPTGPFATILWDYPPSFDGEHFVAWMQDAAGNGGLFALSSFGQIQTFLDFTSTDYGSVLSMTDVEGDEVIASTWWNGRPDFRFNAAGELLGVTDGPLYNDTQRLAILSPGRYLRIGSRNIELHAGSASVPVVSRGGSYLGATGEVIATDADAQDGEVALLLQQPSFERPEYLIGIIRPVPASATPLMTHSPVSQWVEPGKSIVLSAFASGGGLTWQWFKDGQPIDSPTANALPITNITAADLGNYSVVATNTFGEATSDTATLSWLDAPSSPPRLLAEPADQIRLAGSQFVIQVPFDPGVGTGAIAYAWYYNGQKIRGAYGLSVDSAQPYIGGTYRFEITTEHGTVSSREFTITDATPPWPDLPEEFEIQDFTYIDGIARFTVPTIPAHTYETQFTTDLTGEWQSLGTFIAQDYTTTRAYAMNVETQLFFRVRAALPTD
ncbi:immunoglobulin domain-containing protein [Actomonas aquatica]|uniref:Immunoglobulin domain-containing protein n=1 Tax=Actomonas aquatica TaxID=2866162 RepID=A0ABZ1C527_9BACT|nr:immunoglobulin domain-containing protein [Opitutus sp. WL0086]WRQ86452.1 immunoglobulin domain-containing protein [Opitutus sp. WL0086]